ncbi:hypothetical protein WN51_09230 [Melipona quadrifasciata]|uniref:Uncharacterized protein n=1 Tax=Melipona quadrifasciata TaxID=166423 RepID=A0A0N0BJN4_9HYME|nr:hypothetical protein WN51_09230 [Melipona quadrifasciata]
MISNAVRQCFDDLAFNNSRHHPEGYRQVATSYRYIFTISQSGIRKERIALYHLGKNLELTIGVLDQNRILRLGGEKALKVNKEERNQADRLKSPVVAKEVLRPEVPARHVVAIYFSSESQIKSSDDTKATLMANMRPEKELIKARGVKKISNNGVLVETSTKEEMQHVLGNKKLINAGLAISIPAEKRPMIIVYDVPNTLDEKQLLSSLRQQNFVGVEKKKFNETANFVLEVSPQIRETLLNSTKRLKTLQKGFIKNKSKEETEEKSTFPSGPGQQKKQAKTMLGTQLQTVPIRPHKILFAITLRDQPAITSGAQRRNIKEEKKQCSRPPTFPMFCLELFPATPQTSKRRSIKLPFLFLSSTLLYMDTSTNLTFMMALYRCKFSGEDNKYKKPTKMKSRMQKESADEETSAAGDVEARVILTPVKCRVERNRIARPSLKRHLRQRLQRKRVEETLLKVCPLRNRKLLDPALWRREILKIKAIKISN